MVLTPWASVSSWISPNVGFSWRGPSWGRGDMHGVMSSHNNTHREWQMAKWMFNIKMHSPSESSFLIFQSRLLGRRYTIPAGVLFGTLSSSCTMLMSSSSKDSKSYVEDKRAELIWHHSTNILCIATWENEKHAFALSCCLSTPYLSCE